jgi:amino acid transporter
MVTYAAEETREPERTIPRALMIGTAVVVVTYLALNSAYLLVLPFDRVLASTHIAFDATRATAGPAAASAISVLVIVSSFGAMSGIILAGPRVYYAAGVGAQTMKRCIAIAGVVVVTSVVSGLRASEQITLNAETAKTAEKKSQDFSACSGSSALKRRPPSPRSPE